MHVENVLVKRDDGRSSFIDQDRLLIDKIDDYDDFDYCVRGAGRVFGTYGMEVRAP